MRLACLQFDVRARDVDGNASEVEGGLRRARADGVQLVVLPEMWPTSFVEADEVDDALLARSAAAVERLAAWTSELDLAVAGSAFARGVLRPVNRWQLVAHGACIASYDKVHLFRPTAEDACFEAGDRPPACADTRAGRVGGVVCYDLRFPEIARHLFRAGVDVVAVSSQWASARVDQLEALVAGRAVETQAFVASCNRTGHAYVGRRRLELAYPGRSTIVDPLGRVLARGGAEPELVVADVESEVLRELRTRVPVTKDDRPALYARWRADAT